MSRFLFFGLALLLACTAGNSQNQLDATAFSKAVLALAHPQLLDVRTPEEYAGGHVNNAINIDVNGTNFTKAITKLDKTTPTYVYCLAGSRSANAAEILAKAGFKNVYNLQGGVLAWKKNKLPLTSATTAKANSISQADIDAAIKKYPQVLIDFNAKWCGPCKKMEPTLVALEKEGNVHLIRVDIDNNPVLTQQYQISEIPILLAYENGKQVMRFEGLQTLAMIKTAYKNGQ